MDNSQSSNIFSESPNHSINNSMDNTCYQDLLARTKLLLSKKISHSECDSSFSSYFSTVLEDSGCCIVQELNLIKEILSQDDAEIDKVKLLLQDAVYLLQQLSGYLKSVVESVSMLCTYLKPFPTTTGKIIVSIFTHCKESEILYGMYISQVQKELKDIFRNCHELQITYLMILEKHFIFDLTIHDQVDILIDALEINLEIGEIVQTLDVKTMAEQWKGYTMICERYGESLINRNIFNKTTSALSGMVYINFKKAVENNDDKSIVRSLKITSFMIKILLRVCNIFKHSNVKNYQQILKMLIKINLYNSAYLEMFNSKSSNFLNMMNAQINNPTQGLIEELLTDSAFIQCLLHYRMDEIKDEDDLLGLMVLMTTIMTVSIGNNCLGTLKHKLMEYVFELVSQGHVWLNLGLTFNNPSKDRSPLGLYEYLLCCSVAFIVTFNSTEFEVVEISLCKAILGTDFWSALFASDVLVMLARFHNKTVNQVVSLCGIYKKLENNTLFQNSLQQVHLTNTMQRLHGVLSDENKIIVQRQLTSRGLVNFENISLWSVLKINELPNELRHGIENNAVKKFKSIVQNMNSTCKTKEGGTELITILKVVATCSFDTVDHCIEDCIVKMWMKACCKENNSCIDSQFHTGNVWFLQFLEALTLLTSNWRVLNSTKFIQVLHVISSLLQSNNQEVKLLVIDLFLKLSQLNYESYRKPANDYLVEIFRKLIEENNSLVKNTFMYSLRNYASEKCVEVILNQCVDGYEDFIDELHVKHEENNILKEILREASNCKFRHKCMEKSELIVINNESQDSKRTNSNFDFADIDTLFNDNESEHPACKKAKLETSEVDNIVARLETDVETLCLIKENVFNGELKMRIRNLCKKLNDLI